MTTYTFRRIDSEASGLSIHSAQQENVSWGDGVVSWIVSVICRDPVNKNHFIDRMQTYFEDEKNLPLSMQSERLLSQWRRVASPYGVIMPSGSVSSKDQLVARALRVFSRHLLAAESDPKRAVPSLKSMNAAMRFALAAVSRDMRKHPGVFGLSDKTKGAGLLVASFAGRTNTPSHSSVQFLHGLVRFCAIFHGSTVQAVDALLRSHLRKAVLDAWQNQEALTEDPLVAAFAS